MKTASLEENMDKFIKNLEELKKSTEEVMPLVSKSLGLTIEIAKMYKEAIKELVKINGK